MFNGLHLLILMAIILFLFLLNEFRIKYYDWSIWNRQRRRARKLYLFDVEEKRQEDEYRNYLRTLTVPGIIASMHRTIRAFEKLNLAFSKSQEKQSA